MEETQSHTFILVWFVLMFKSSLAFLDVILHSTTKDTKYAAVFMDTACAVFADKTTIWFL